MFLLTWPEAALTLTIRNLANLLFIVMTWKEKDSHSSYFFFFLKISAYLQLWQEFVVYRPDVFQLLE